MSVEMNKEKWPNSSKRSYAYSQSTDTHYEDFGYFCVKCKCHCVFSAEDQKIEYEENQRFIWHKKILCANCQLQIDALREKARQFQKRWARNRNILKTDRQFLCDWLAILEGIPTYGKKSHIDLIATLRKLSYGCV
ncbi:hypothetical protein [Undibacterium sp. SXout20W]|uniref:hypothetical protein n=1 Tax=Undibacterium sp. SXout20W TaxID=3413051 RepID=UPI003BF57084